MKEEVSHYPNRQIKCTGQIENGQKEGVWVYFFENGQKRLEVHYKKNKKDGLWTEWYENGQIAEQGRYMNDNYIVDNFWDESGNQLLTEGTGKTIRKFGYNDGDVYEQYFEKGVFIGEKKISGVSYRGFIPKDQ